MKPLFFNREHKHTAFVQLDTRNCNACWACLAACPNKVIGRVNLPWHKHALLLETTKCTGCKKCVKACKHNALTKRTNNEI